MDENFNLIPGGKMETLIKRKQAVVISEGLRNNALVVYADRLYRYDGRDYVFQRRWGWGRIKMKKVYLVHGWGGNSDYFKELKLFLENNKIKAETFDMPDTNNPKIELWVEFLNKKIKNIDKDTYFVGHSIGCQTIIRFLENLPDNVKVGGAYFIAGWFTLKGLNEEEKKIAKPWLETKINFDKLIKHTNNFIALFSDDDPVVPLDNADLFKERLKAKIDIMKNKGHFDSFNDSNEFEMILNFIK